MMHYFLDLMRKWDIVEITKKNVKPTTVNAQKAA
jgi:hypothetical protein